MKQWLQNIFYWWAGLGILILNKPRHALKGYTRPREFPIHEFDRAIEYDLDVVRSWEQYGKKYLGEQFSWNGHSILELGPGADLGVGITLLAAGAQSYHALDVNPLVVSTPKELYRVLAKRLAESGYNIGSIEALKNKINYVCDKEFNIKKFKDQQIDLVVSNASFEHFSDVKNTIKQVSEAIQAGGLLIAEVDLQTHSRWIRGADPLNIYRYPNWIYRLLSFSGTPNRVRPETYKNWLTEYGWENISIYPKKTISTEEVKAVRNSLSKKFSGEQESLRWLSIVICATKK